MMIQTYSSLSTGLMNQIWNNRILEPKVWKTSYLSKNESLRKQEEVETKLLETKQLYM